jgi:DNA modification methylase
MNAPYHQQPEAWEADDARTATGRPAGTALVPRDPTAAANLTSPRLLEGARRALAEAATLPELTPLIDQAEVVRLAARKAHLSREAQNAWAEYALDAERKAGALLTHLAATRGLAPGGRPAETGDTRSPVSAPTLVELGVAAEPGLARQRSSRWQQLAAIPDAAYAQLKADVRADPDAVLTRAAALALAKRLRGPSAHAVGHARRAAAFETAAPAPGGAGARPDDVVTASAADPFLDALIARGTRAHLCVTSPAYWMKRTYTDGHPDELGQEPRPADYVARLCATVDRIGQVLLPGGCLYLNLGDTYASQPGQSRGDPERARGISARAAAANGTAPAGRRLDVAEKSLCLIPWRVALALVLEHGWRCASIIAWIKDGHAPENVFDRYTQAWEPIFVLTRGAHAYLRREHLPAVDDVWVIPVGRRGAAAGHPAPFPDELVERAIRAACPEGGTVLDPFAGSATVRDVAVRLGRRFLGCDLLGEPAAGGPR